MYAHNLNILGEKDSWKILKKNHIDVHSRDVVWLNVVLQLFSETSKYDWHALSTSINNFSIEVLLKKEKQYN